MNKLSKSALVALALVTAPVAATVVYAQTNPPATTQNAQKTNYSSVFLGKLASALGVTQDKLAAGIKTAGNATIDEALKNQDITKTQADRLRQDVTNGRVPFLGGMGGPRDGMGGPGPRGGFGGRGMGGPGFAGFMVFDAAAKALGLSSDQLRSELQSGKTIPEIAKAKNISEKTVRDAALAALKTQLDADVKAGRLTQAQADERLKRAQEDPNFGLGLGRRGPGPRR